MSDDTIAVTLQMADAINLFLQKNAAAMSSPSPADTPPENRWMYIPPTVDFSQFVGGGIRRGGPNDGKIETRMTYLGNLPVGFQITTARAVIDANDGGVKSTVGTCKTGPLTVALSRESPYARVIGPGCDKGLSLEAPIGPAAAAVLIGALFGFEEAGPGVVATDTMRAEAASLRQEMGLPSQKQTLKMR